MSIPVSRRHFLRTAAAVTVGFGGLGSLLGCATRASASRAAMSSGPGSRAAEGYGPLIPDPDGIMDLPEGFSYQIVARTGDRMSDGLFVPGAPDGMAAFPGENGRTLVVCNHELNFEHSAPGPFGPENRFRDLLFDETLLYDRGAAAGACKGGTTTFVYDTKRRLKEAQFLSLAGTERNCAGGPTPWNSWITCEETVARAGESRRMDHGYNFEVPAMLPGRPIEPVALKAMGRFNHEAVAVDPGSGIVYQTEDTGDGLIYRFLPASPERLHKGGVLQALAVKGQPSLDTRNWEAALVAEGAEFETEWIDVDDVEAPENDLRLRGFAAGAARFARGEGMWYGNDAVYFACTNGGAKKLGQIWRYVPSPREGTPREKDMPGKLHLFLEPNDGALVQNADNLTVAPWGDVVVCEDGGGVDRVFGVTPQGRVYHIASGCTDGELAGVCFSPDGTTMFVNAQVRGLTLAIVGPWKKRLA